MTAAATFTNLTRALEIGANSYLLELAGHRIALDAGLHPRVEGPDAAPNLHLIEPDSLDAIIVSHAHQDHIGAIPLLQRRSPDTRVLATDATRRISEIMLHNSVNVMIKQREEENVAGYPLFLHREVDLALKRWQSCPLNTRISTAGERVGREQTDDVTIEFIDAGHILGSAGVVLRGGGKTIFYTGDVQFADQTIMGAAKFPDFAGEPVDTMIIETTRGDHPTPPGFSREQEERRFAEALRESFAAGSCILIPVFALGKSQELLAMLHRFRQQGLLPREFPIYIGGLTAKVTEIYDRLTHQTPRNLRGFELLNTIAPFVAAGQSARDLPVKPGRICALSSGMMGRHTLSNFFAQKLISDPRHAVFFIGYTAPDSPAGILRATPPGGTIQLASEFPEQEVRCRIDSFDFTAHAAREDMRAYVNRVRPRRVVLVHGDAPAMQWYADTLGADLPDCQVILPEPGVAVALD